MWYNINECVSERGLEIFFRPASSDPGKDKTLDSFEADNLDEAIKIFAVWIKSFRNQGLGITNVV